MRDRRTYRGARRNAYFGRKPKGNTKAPRLNRNPGSKPMPYNITGRLRGTVRNWGAF